MPFTREQADCVRIHDRNLIVTAGAGSGKTHVLVERFVDLLQQHPDWSLPSVVAITFTEKAAREMRDRVRGAIEERIRQAAADEDSAALDLWLDHRTALNNARIGTIHALCAQVLRANPAEAEVDPGFEVLDENESAILREDAVDQALALLVREAHPAAQLLVWHGVPQVRGVLRDHAERSRAGEVYAALAGSADDLLARWCADWDSAAREITERVQEDDLVWDALHWEGTFDLPQGDKLAAVWEEVIAQADALYVQDPPAVIQAARVLINLIKLNGGSPAKWGSVEQLEEAKDTLRCIRDRLKSVLADLPPYPGEDDRRAAEHLLLWRDAITRAAGEYARLKAERNALDFDDLEAATCALLNRAPEVSARYGREFRHVLVDEFQDTNQAQRQIVYALAGVRAAQAGGRLFVVGDPKQSIYAFRGADVSVFGQVREDLTGWGGRELLLSTSFRTHGALVGALNDLFARILRVGEGPLARYEVALGEPMRALRPAEPDRLPHHQQPVTVLAIQPPESSAYPTWQSADELRRWEAWELAQQIHRLVRGGTLIWDRDLPHDGAPPAGAYLPEFSREAGRGGYRPMTHGDVAILFQAMTRAPLYEEVFKAAGLPYVTIAGKGYYGRQEVQDLLHLLHALYHPADDLSLAVVLRSPLFSLSDDALYALRLAARANGDPLPLWEALLDPGAAPLFPPADEPARAFAAAVLLELRDLAGRVPVAELLTRALHRTGYLAALTGLPDGARRRGNVDKLLKLARESGRVSLGAFLAYTRDLTAREVREGEAAVEVEGAVQLMSVHKSKGLEFPVVVLADATWSRRADRGLFALDPLAGAACKLPADEIRAARQKRDDPYAWQRVQAFARRREQAERRRLLYVGATRAQDLLIVSGALHAKCPKDTWLHQWLDALNVNPADIDPGPDPVIYACGAVEVAVFVPDVPPPLDDRAADAESAAWGWDDEAVQAGQPFAGVDPILPPLLDAVPVDPQAPARALTATQIAQLGRVPFYDPTARGRAAFRHSVLHDAPEPVRPPAGREVGGAAFRRIVGEMVHRALRAWTLPGNTEADALEQRLLTYAWEQGLTDPQQVDWALYEAVELLKRFETSEVPGALEGAAQVYRELPFVYHPARKSSDLTVHGVIDVLYLDRGGVWHVLDYKTAPVSSGGAWENARRYYLQVGVYASAVAAKTGQTPKVHLYYIHPGRLVTVRPEDWQAALERLDDDLRQALELAD